MFLFRLQISIRHGDLLYFEDAGGTLSRCRKTQYQQQMVVPRCVLAVRQQQERSIKGVIPWMQLKTNLNYVLSCRGTQLYPSVKDNTVYFLTYLLFSSLCLSSFRYEVVGFLASVFFFLFNMWPSVFHF